MNKNKKKYFSYSQLNTFSNCPQKYKIQYIDKVKSEKEGIESFTGKIVHEVLEWLYNNSNEDNFISFDKVSDRFDQLWNEKWHNEIYVAINPYIKKDYHIKKGQYKAEALNNVRMYYVKYFKSDNNNQSTELNIKIKINEYIFKGIIDRIDIINNRIDLIDYKTGKNKVKLSLLDKLQLYIYQLAIEKQYNDKNIYLNWHYINKKGGNKQIVLDKKDRAKLNKKLLSIINNIKKSTSTNVFPAKETLLCNWCYYWNECSVKKDLNEINPSKKVL